MVRPIRSAVSIALAVLTGVLVLAAPAAGAPIARTTSLISAPTGVADPDSAAVFFSGVSADGARVFLSTDQKLTADDGDSDRMDVYERAGGVTRLVSAPTGVSDLDTSSAGFLGASAGGSRVFFGSSQKMTTEDGDSGFGDIFQREGGVTTLISAPTGVADPDTDNADFNGVSVDGSRVLFTTAQKLDASDQDSDRRDVYERAGGVTTLMSRPTGVADPDNAAVSFGGSSADGSRVFFNTTQKLTADDGDTNREDVYERSGGITTLVSSPTGVAELNTNNATFRGASSDGTHVFFETNQKLTTDDTDTNRTDVYERSGGVTTLVSGPTGVTDPNTAGVFFKGASADGTRVLLETNQKLASADGDTNRTDVYERAGGVTTLVSGPTGVADPDSENVFFAGASADAVRIFFNTAQRLTADDNDSGRADVLERAAGVTTLLSAPTGVADPDTFPANFGGSSADGSRVFFSTAEKLSAADGDTNGFDVYERAEGVTTLVSAANGEPETNGFNGFSGASADGTRVFFQSSDKLTAADGDTGQADVYMAADITAPETAIVGGPLGTTGDPTPSFIFLADDPGATFECKVDTGAFAPCTSPVTVSALADGPHSFQVRARDSLGNVEASPAVRAFTVDTSPPGDSTPPTGKLSGKKTQKLGKTVSVTVACLDEACTALATASARVPTNFSRTFKLRRAKRSIAKGRKAKLKLKLSKKTRGAAKRALRRRRKVRVKIKVTLTDAAGNARVLRRTVKLKR